MQKKISEKYTFNGQTSIFIMACISSQVYHILYDHDDHLGTLYSDANFTVQASLLCYTDIKILRWAFHYTEQL